MINRHSTSGLVVQALGSQDRPPLVLVHGWGMGSQIWQPLLDELQQSFDLYLLDLPGYGVARAVPNNAWQLDLLMAEFAERIRQPAIWCGWSLGGMLATRYAAWKPEGVKALLTFGSNPVFVANADWPTAMAQEAFASFSKAVSEQPQTALKRFLGLVTQGSESIRADIRALQPLLSNPPEPEQLVASLNLLGRLDTRASIAKLDVPQCHVYSERDALVPVSVAQATQSLNPQAKIKIIAGASHIPWLSKAPIVLAIIRALAKRSERSE